MTIRVRPSLRETQAVGALLLHQFAQERFREANLDVRPIREAEESLGLNELAEDMLYEQPAEESSNSSMEFVENSVSVDDSQSQSNDPNQTVHNNSTTSTNRPDCSASLNGSSTLHNVEENFHSIANISETQNGTFYHSLNQSTTAFDRLQASPSLASYGKELRRIAEEFEKSRLRQEVRRKAADIDVDSITKEGFMQLLENLFQGEITRERIVILFVFCTDVALKAVQAAQQKAIELISWSFRYIIDIVCNFIHKLGGWDRVLFYQLPSLLITCCAALAIFSLVVFLKRNLLRTP